MIKDRKTKIRIFIYIVALILLSVIQSVPGINFAIKGVTPILLIPAVVCIGMFEREYIGGYLGLFAGMLWDLWGTSAVGLHAILLMIIGVVCGLFITDLLHNNMISAIILCTASMFFYGAVTLTAMYFSKESETIAYFTEKKLLPQLLYSLVFVIPLYLIFRAMIKKVKQSGYR